MKAVIEHSQIELQEFENLALGFCIARRGHVRDWFSYRYEEDHTNLANSADQRDVWEVSRRLE